MTSEAAIPMIRVERHPRWVEITLNRPESRNAMNAQMVRELQVTVEALRGDDEAQALVLRGAGGHFCSGGDVREMRAQLHNEHSDERDPLIEMNRAFGELLLTLEAAPQVVIVALEGAVMGGGFGLACVSDIALALPSARFGLPEVTLGITPAQIAPFVVARLGVTRARQLALTGARFDARAALSYGVIHELCADERALASRLSELLRQVSACAPEARALTKRLILEARSGVSHALLDTAAEGFARAARSDEAREGMRAFLTRERPAWERAWGEVSYD